MAAVNIFSFSLVFAKSEKDLSLSTFMTSLELILSKIPELRKPAASRRLAATCLVEKLPYLLKEKIGARKNKKKKGNFSARLRADARAAGNYFRSGGARHSLFFESPLPSRPRLN